MKKINDLNPINVTSRFYKKLFKEGKIIPLNKPEHLKAQEEVNKTMEETRRIFRIMDAGSNESARNCWVGHSSVA